MDTHFLNMIGSPEDLRVLNRKQLLLLAREIRKTLIETVAKTGGHLAPSLGVVELTIALHYVFNSPEDKIVWDVGHQAYPHKMLTGRANQLHTIRQFKGISGFPKQKESIHDAFGTGHSSTAISAALGMAKVRDFEERDNKVVAVVGDGALTGGIAFEGLNQAGHLKSDLLVILNDNEMSIDPNVGAMSSYLSKMITHPKYKDLKIKLESFLRRWSKKAAKKALALEDAIRALSGPGLLFREMGFKYFGPVNGHDLHSLILVLRNIKDIKGPVLLHVITKKGKGYLPAEQSQVAFHGISKFNVDNGEKLGGPSKLTFTDAFANALIKLAKDDKRVVGITAAMAPGTGLSKFQAEFPNRFFDVGIAEQHAVTFAGGLASDGYKPVCAIYSTFLQRAYDQIIHDIAIQNLDVIFAIDRAGLVGEDGPTHHGTMDISYLRTIPNFTIMAPKNEEELGHMLKTAMSIKGPVAIRYPKGSSKNSVEAKDLKTIPQKMEILRPGKDITIIAAGPHVYDALEVANNSKKSIQVVNARFIKPVDEQTLIKIAKKTKKIITLEENNLAGGFGSAILESCQKLKLSVTIKRIGIQDEFIEHGKRDEILDVAGITKKAIEKAIRE